MLSHFLARDTANSPFTQELHNSADRRRFRILQFYRYLISLCVIYFLCQIIPFGISENSLFLSCALGIALAARFLKNGFYLPQMILVHLLLYLLGSLSLKIANYLITGDANTQPETDFFVAQISDTAFLLALFYGFGFLSTWFFWTRSQAATFEGLLGGVGLVWFLSGHRNYHLDAPKQISSLTWKLNLLQKYHVQPQHLFIYIAGFFLVHLTIYFLLASTRPIIRRSVEKKDFGSRQVFSAVLTPIIFLICLVYYGKLLNQRYSADLSRATEGVGQATKAGESNLGFHKAVSQTNQPAALVRLEGDYSKNPAAPMLYFREGALSTFNGREFVAAGVEYDTDVPRIQPGQPYIALASESNELREKVVQSIYLLSKHNTPPAIDYPARISILKNPDPERFVLAYQVVSQAPAVKINELFGKNVGDSHWDQSALNHYLRAPGSLTTDPPAEIPVDPDKPFPDAHNEDLRYLGLTRQLTGGLSDPLARAESIINYLSQQSIYTKDPGHQVAGDGDPVAPYLFAPKKRGYCVHFAHAAAYMLRLAGIPSRIGTGYLTDLQYAKDGHILLQMGDRHAWPEIYVEGMGWTIVDVNPAQAENEQAPVPDSKLLEELMNKINPTDELITPPEKVDETIKKSALIEKVIDSRLLIPSLACFFLSVMLFKFYLRFAYAFTRDERRRAQLAYASFALQMTDLGYQRKLGETRHEYQERLMRDAIDAQKITALNEKSYYSKDPLSSLPEIRSAFAEWQSSYDQGNSKLKRYLSFFSVRSLLRLWRW